MADPSKPSITLYYLNASRAIRVAWLLSALSLPYNLIRTERAPNGLAPPEFRSQIPGALRKSPTLTDVLEDGSELVLQESGAILMYLCERYDKERKYWPKAEGSGQARREHAKIAEWVAASEGTFGMHGIAIMYARSRLPTNLPNRSEVWAEMNSVMSNNMFNALDWLEKELKVIHDSGSRFLVGGRLTAAEFAMLFSLQLIFNRKLGLEGLEGGGKGKWKEVDKWMAYCEEEESWKECVERVEWRMYGML